jgi:hypothetical protein
MPKRGRVMIFNEAAVTDKLSNAIDDLREAVFETYRVIAVLGAGPMGEAEWKAVKLEHIKEHRQSHHLARFSAAHLEVLDLLNAIWRELTVEKQAPQPEPLQ